jgi:hypothetical protein
MTLRWGSLNVIIITNAVRISYVLKRDLFLMRRVRINVASDRLIRIYWLLIYTPS